MKEGLSDGGGHPTQLLPSLPRLQRPSRDGPNCFFFLPPMAAAAKPTGTDELDDDDCDAEEDSSGGGGGRWRLSACSAVLSGSAQTA